MTFQSVDEVLEFSSLMRLVVDPRGVVDFRRVAGLFGVSASDVATIEVRSAHLIRAPPVALAKLLSARWRATHLLQSSADEDLGRSVSPLVDALAVLELRLQSLPLAAFVERAAFLYASVKGRHLIALQAGQVMPAGDPDADDIEDIVGDYELNGLLRSALQLERGDAPITGECRWYSIITACTPPLATWESTDPPWPIRETAAPLDTARDALMFSTLRRFCGHIDAAAADESAPPLQAIAPSDIEEARASMSETGAQERASAAMRDAEADYADRAEPSCDELRRAAIADEGPAADEA